jgi:hypothetical protein
MASEMTREELEAAFRSDPKYGMECLECFFGDEIASYIKFVGHGALDSHDLADIYQNVMVEMIIACRRPNFDPAEPMRLVYRIAMTNTKEYLRNRGIRTATNLDDCLPYLAADLKDTNVELRWKYTTLEQQREFRFALFDVINECLPNMQRETAIVFITRYEKTRESDRFEAVASGIRERTGKDITAAAAKQNWYRARTVIAEEMKKRGFDFLLSE